MPVRSFNDSEIKKILETSKLKYISKTYSSYNITYLTLTSIMEIDFPVIESDTKYVNRGKFYSSMMYRNKLIPLPELVNQAGGKFIWVGNFWGNCVELLNKPWKCIYDKSLINIMRLTSTIYFTTPLKPIFLKISSHLLDHELFVPNRGEKISEGEILRSVALRIFFICSS